MRNRTVFSLLAMIMLLTACYHRGQQTPDAWDLTRQQYDSISFSTTHHYTQNYNFVVNADHLPLADNVADQAFDTLYVVRGEREILIPDVPDFILDLNPETGLTVHLIEGM